jgi:2-methylcitrate dehydratase PrpD
LLGEPLTPELYSERKMRSAPVLAMLRRIECLEDPAMDLDWFKRNIMRSRVEVTLKSGQRFEQAATFPVDKPKYGHAQVVAKLAAMADGLLPPSRVAQIVETVDTLEKVPDMTRLARLLVPPTKRSARPSKTTRATRRKARYS